MHTSFPVVVGTVGMLPEPLGMSVSPVELVVGPPGRLVALTPKRANETDKAFFIYFIIDLNLTGKL
jgi:hypothetical protein